ncbi:hypothetical protein HQ544_04965 [Candidatus Falkowbacteria bacterium]|nr:hypothetical protein [Candidatus Falkowbacteria bacterium]
MSEPEVRNWYRGVQQELDELSIEEALKIVSAPYSGIDMERDCVARGEVPDELKRMWLLAHLKSRDCALAKVDIAFMVDSAKGAEFARKLRRLEREAKQLMEGFWVSIKDTYDLWDYAVVTIRTGWVVTYREAPSFAEEIEEVAGDLPAGLQDFLRRTFMRWRWPSTR